MKKAKIYILAYSDGQFKIGYTSTGTTNMMVDFDTTVTVCSTIITPSPDIAKKWVEKLKLRFGIKGSMYRAKSLKDISPEDGFLKSTALSTQEQSGKKW